MLAIIGMTTFLSGGVHGPGFRGFALSAAFANAVDAAFCSRIWCSPTNTTLSENGRSFAGLSIVYAAIRMALYLSVGYGTDARYNQIILNAVNFTYFFP
jgi:hypothetical protein